MRTGFPAFVLLFLALSSSVAQLRPQIGSTPTFRQLLTAQDKRDVRGLLPFFSDRDAGVRTRAAIAAGSVQDTSHILPLAALLDDEHAPVRLAAAFALGQMTYVVDSVARRRVSDELLRRFDTEIDGEVTLRMVEALGKVGDAVSLSELVKPRTQRRPFPVEWEIAFGIGRYAYRNIKSKDATSYAMRMLESSTGRDRWKAAYGIMRINDRELLDEHVSRIAAAAISQDPDVRMLLATPLGRFADRRVAELTLLRLIQDDDDWRVRVNAVKGLAAARDTVGETLALALLQAAEDPEEHVSLAALATLRSVRLTPAVGATVQMTLAGMVESVQSKFSGRQKREAAISWAAFGGDAAYERLKQARANERLGQIPYVEALGALPGDAARTEIISSIKIAEPRLAHAALEALQQSLKRGVSSLAMVEQVRTGVVLALASDDLAVLTTAATLLGDSVLAHSRSTPELLLALRRLSTPADVEPMVAIIKTLGILKDQIAVPTLFNLLTDPDRTVALEAATSLESITGNSYSHLVPKHSKVLHTNYNWEMLEWIQRNPDVIVRTNRGEFTITMLPDEAPFTCINFSTLIWKNFFDGLTFHRVVPNFVVQGGDPRGDGWGGPGYSIRSEFGLSHYGRGYVGVASAGKDTEGCQFFVTHSPQPHLDGRYTIFGRVISGMGVVDRLQIGDVIEEMAFTAASRPQRRE